MDGYENKIIRIEKERNKDETDRRKEKCRYWYR